MINHHETTIPATLQGIAIRTYKHAPMQTLDQALVTCSSGVANDSRGKPGKRQVTLLSEASWQQVCKQLQTRHLTTDATHSTYTGAHPTTSPPSWLTRRANLLVSDKIFCAADIGSTVHIGQCLLEITQECDPCYKMDNQINGLQALLAPAFTAGVCCTVLNGGTIALGDTVTFISPPTQKTLF